MNKWYIDFESIKPHIIDSFSTVYGEEYRSIITERINNAIILYYENIDGLDNYLSYLRNCKKRELSFKFLKQIGIDIKMDNFNAFSSFDKETNDILDCLIDSDFSFDKYAYYYSPLLAYTKTNKMTPERVLKKKIEVINYFIKDAQNKIDENSISSFIETEEYKLIYKKIKKYLKIYMDLMEEYNNWNQQFIPYMEHIKEENERRKKILRKKEDELLLIITKNMPISIKNRLCKKSINEQKELIMDYYLGVKYPTIIESFSKEEMNELTSSTTSRGMKECIIIKQVEFLKKLGVKCPNFINLKDYNETVINDYFSFLNSEGVKEYVPTDDFISFVENSRKQKYEEGIKEFIRNGEDFKTITESFNQNEDNLNAIYARIKDQLVCITSHGSYTNNEFKSLIFYTIRDIDGGNLSFSLLHECGHVIDQASHIGSGFDLDDKGINSYDKNSRKYEKLNETLNDIYTLEARDILQSKGIYLIEPKEITLLDVSNYNTNSITKEFLKPLLYKFRNEVTQSKINTNPQILMDYIGENNFEELNDVINKVDYLTRHGLNLEMVNLYPNDTMVLEYLEQVERAKQIYNNIDEYYENKFGNIKKRIRDNKKAIK